MPAPAAVRPQRHAWDSLVLPVGWAAELDAPALPQRHPRGSVSSLLLPEGWQPELDAPPQCVSVPVHVVAPGVSQPAARDLPAPAADLPRRHPWGSLVLPVGWRAELDSPALGMCSVAPVVPEGLEAQLGAPALPQRHPWDALLLPEGWRAELDVPLGNNSFAPVMPF